MAKRPMFKSVKTTLWGVFYIGSAFGQFRAIIAAFAEKRDADSYAAKYKAENSWAKVMVEEIKATMPAWDGQVPDQSQYTAENACIF